MPRYERGLSTSITIGEECGHPLGDYPDVFTHAFVENFAMPPVVLDALSQPADFSVDNTKLVVDTTKLVVDTTELIVGVTAVFTGAGH